jgi:hypothetical protein
MDKRVEYDLEYDTQDNDFKYLTTHNDVMIINDINQGNYNQGYIEFSNLNIQSPSTEHALLWSQSYVQVLHEVRLTCSRGAFARPLLTGGNITGLAESVENSCAITPKSAIHLIDNASIKLSGFSINQPCEFTNLYMNEKLKEMPHDKYSILSDILGHEFDTADSLFLPPTSVGHNVCETNNNTYYQNKTNAFTYGNAPASYLNEGHLKRIRNNNYDISGTNGNSPFLGPNDAKIFNGSTADDVLQQGCYVNDEGTWNNITTANNGELRFRFVSNIPLALISDFYQQMPSMLSTSKFSLRLQMNCAKQNIWALTYNVTGNVNDVDNLLKPKLVSATNSVGNSCPYLVSQLYQLDEVLANRIGKGTGLTWVSADGVTTDMTITVQPQIGWRSLASYPCRLIVPRVKINPQYSIIEKNPTKKIVYEELYVHQIQNVSPTEKVSLQIPVQLSMVKSIMLIPFMTSHTAMTVPGIPSYQSLVSSAPTTSSYSRIKNLMIQIGGVNVFPQTLNMNSEFYLDNLLPMSSLNGSNFKSDLWSSQISYSDFQKCYTVYKFDVRKWESIQIDSALKSFQLSFQNNIANYNQTFIVMCIYERSVVIDRITGEIEK